MEISTIKKAMGNVAELGVAGYFAFREIKTTIITVGAVFEFHKYPMPRPTPPEFCRALRKGVINEGRNAIGYGICGAALQFGGVDSIVGKEALLFSGVRVVLLMAVLNVERKYCGSPDDKNQNKKEDDVGPSIAERLRQLVGEWQPTARIAPSQSYHSYWQTVSPNDYLDDDIIGNMLPGLVFGLGGVLASGARSILPSGLQWGRAIPQWVPAFN